MTFKVMRLAQTIAVGVKTGDGMVRLIAKRMVRPPVPMLAGAAENTYQAVFGMRFLENVRESEETMMRKATVFAEHYDRDGDSVNDRTIAARRNWLRQGHGTRRCPQT